MTAYIVLCR